MLFSSRPYCSACIPNGFLLSGLFLCLLSLPLSAQQATLERLWTGLKTESRITDFAASGDVGYVASPRGLEVYDLTTPRLQLLSTHELIPKGEVRLRVADDTLLLAWDADTGVSLFSIADRLAPRFLKHIIAWKMEDADAKGDQLFIAWRQTQYPYVLQVAWKEEEQIGRSILRSMGGFHKVMVVGEYVYALGYGYDNDEIHIARLVEGGVAEDIGKIEPGYLFISDFAVQDSLVLLLRNWNRLDGQVVDILRWDEAGVLRWWKEERLESGYIMGSLVANDSLLVFYGERSLLPGQSEQTLLSGQIIADSVVAFLDTLEVGLVRDQPDEFVLNKERIVYRNYTGLYAGTIDRSGQIEKKGNQSIGMLSMDVSGSKRDRIFALTTDSLHVIDFTNPEEPIFLSGTAIRAEGVAAVNRDRVITFDSVVTLFDVSDPGLPVKLDSLNLGKDRIVWEAEVSDSVIVLCCLEGGTVVLVVRDDRLHKACEVQARSSDALWTGGGLLLTTLDTTGGEWREFAVEESACEWASADQLNVWGITGQSLTQTGDTVIAASGRELVVYDAEQFSAPPAFVEATSDVRLNTPTGLEYHAGLLYVERTDLGFLLYHFDSLNGLSRLGWWEIHWLGNQRFCVADTVLFAPEGIFGFQSFGVRFGTASVEERRSADSDFRLTLSPNVVDRNAELRFQLSSGRFIRLGIYNSLGILIKEIASGECVAGEYRVNVETTDLPSGTYWILLEDQNGERINAPFRVVR